MVLMIRAAFSWLPVHAGIDPRNEAEEGRRDGFPRGKLLKYRAILCRRKSRRLLRALLERRFDLIYDDSRDHASRRIAAPTVPSGGSLNPERGVRSRGFNGAERSWNGQLVTM
jgi:hypothetical protein